MATKKKSKKMVKVDNHEVGDVVVTIAQKKGFEFLVGFPARAGDKTYALKDGILLSVKEVKLIGTYEFYILEIVTGKDASDLIYISTGLTEMMEKVPMTRRR